LVPHFQCLAISSYCLVSHFWVLQIHCPAPLLCARRYAHKRTDRDIHIQRKEYLRRSVHLLSRENESSNFTRYWTLQFSFCFTFVGSDKHFVVYTAAAAGEREEQREREEREEPLLGVWLINYLSDPRGIDGPSLRILCIPMILAVSLCGVLSPASETRQLLQPLLWQRYRYFLMLSFIGFQKEFGSLTHSAFLSMQLQPGSRTTKISLL